MQNARIRVFFVEALISFEQIEMSRESPKFWEFKEHSRTPTALIVD
jgi:hypothetical protein